MKQIDLFNIKLNHIRIFLAAAEYLNFSKAAKQLYITQPMVSKTIQTLEEELNLILFLREKGKLQLTPAGRELYVQWKNLLQFFENSIEDASALQEGRRGRIVLGIGSLTSQKLLNRLGKCQEALQPEISLHFETVNQSEGWKMLQKGELDALLASGHNLSGQEQVGLQWIPVVQTELAVFISEKNPLSRKSDLQFKDLKQEKFIALSSDTNSRYISLLNDLASKAGFVPKIACYIRGEDSFRPNLLLNNGIVLADSDCSLEEDHIRKFILHGYPNNICLVWHMPIRKKGLRELISALSQGYLNPEQADTAIL